MATVTTREATTGLRKARLLEAVRARPGRGVSEYARRLGYASLSVRRMARELVEEGKVRIVRYTTGWALEPVPEEAGRSPGGS